MAIAGLLKGVIGPIINKFVDRIPDPNARAEAKEQLELEMLGSLENLIVGQLEINKAEAQHKSLFVAGWRPGVGWICALALGWNFILQPIMAWIFVITGYSIADAPMLETGELTTILLGMLGLGGLRTYEKRLGVASENMGKK